MAKKIKYIGSKAVNKDSLPSFSVFNDSFQTTIFNGGINLSTVLTTNTTIKREKRIIITQKNVSLSDLKIRDIDELNNFIKITNKLKLNLDTSNLSNYAVYGSLKEKFRFAINNIINKFPGGIFADTFVNGVSYYNVLNYSYDSTNDLSTFRVPVTVLDNPFYVNLYNSINLTSNSINSLTTRFLDYTLFYNDINYGINGFTGFSNTNSSYLYFSIIGNPFVIFSASSISEKFVIKPNDIEFNKFYDSLNDLERYILNKNSTPKYTFKFKIPEINEDDELEFINYDFTFPLKSDGYNLDTNSVSYIDFLENLFGVGDLYDEYKSNLIIRKFIPKTLIDFDGTDSFKSETIFKVYGKEIDEIKMFIDSLMNINTVSYDKISNIPDALIKNLARTLGWKAQNIINDKDLLSSVFANDKSGDTDITASLAEVDIELWRRLTINTAWFLKSKGTRKSIETIFTFIGAPDCLITLDEHVYVVDAPLNSSLVNQTLLSDTTGLVLKPAYDVDGFPANPTFTTTDYFQANGIEDSGKYFIDLYRKLGFTVTRVIDNKKSWVYYESGSTHSSSGRNTNYYINDSRLIINTKEVTLNLDAARAIECDVYNFNQEYNYPVSSTGSTSSRYPQRESNKIDTTKLTFSEYIQEIYSKFINVQNRKVTDSAIGSHYPSLTKLYYDYYVDSNSNKRNYRDLSKYIDGLDNIFDTFIKQFIPATTIFADSAFNVRNTIFTPQKFTYKHGIDDGSEFQSEIQVPIQTETSIVTIESEFFNTYENDITIATIDSFIEVGSNGNINTPFLTNVTENVNLQPLWNSKVCENEKSTFALTGGTKIELSSFTNNSIFDNTLETGHTVTFNFTSGTSTLSSNTTNFYYTLHKYNKTTLGFEDTPIYTFKAKGYTAFTSSTVITDILNGLTLNNDSEYLIKPYFEYTSCPETGTTFSATSPYNQYDLFLISGYTVQSYIDSTGGTKFYNQSERYFDYTGFTINTGSSILTLIDKTSYIPTFNIYNKLDDYYFVSTNSPDKPLIQIPSQVPDSSSLFVENIPVQTDSFSSFTISYEPVGDVIVAVNGVTIQKIIEYDTDNSITTAALRNRSFILKQRLTSLHKDVLTVAYYRNTANTQKVVREDLLFTGSTQIVSASTGFYEVSLSNQRYNSTSEVLVYYNGLLLTKGSDYNISTFNINKIVLFFTPVDPSIISIIYFTNYNSSITQLVEATGPLYTLNWNINNLIPNNIIGKFTHQFYELTNTGLTGNTFYSSTTDYDYTITNFTKIFDWTQTSPLAYGSTYFYRIVSTKSFTTINNVDLGSTTYSDTLRIKIPV